MKDKLDPNIEDKVPLPQDVSENQHQQDLREAIALGEEAKNFLNSDLARYIRNAAELRVVSAQHQLSTIDPHNAANIIKLQGVIKQFDHFDGCIREIVAAGDSAYQMYLQEHASNNME